MAAPLAPATYPESRAADRQSVLFCLVSTHLTPPVLQHHTLFEESPNHSLSPMGRGLGRGANVGTVLIPLTLALSREGEGTVTLMIYSNINLPFTTYHNHSHDAGVSESLAPPTTKARTLAAASASGMARNFCAALLVSLMVSR